MSKQNVSTRKVGMSANQSTHPQQASVFCGIDVSAETLAVAVIELDQPLEQREFANSSSGHKALLAWLGKRKALVRVSLEATGIYSLDLALTLDASEGVEVAVLNPKRIHDFARSLRRSKTDAAVAAAQPERTGTARHQSPYRSARRGAHAGHQSTTRCAGVDGNAALRGRGPEAFAGHAQAAHPEAAARGPGAGRQ